MTSNLDENYYDDSKLQINLFATLRKRWEYVVFGTLLGVGLAALYVYTTVPLYQSEIEILVGQRSSELTNSGTITGANASGDAIQEDQLATHMRLITSRLLLAEAVKTNKLAELASFKDAATKGDSAIDHIIKHLTVHHGGEGTSRDAMVLRASFRDPNPEDAAAILAAIFESYRSYVESHGEDSSQQAVQLIEEARQTHETELALANEEYLAFLQSVRALIDGDKVQDIHKERMTKLETELNMVRNTLAEQQSRLEVINNFYSNHEPKENEKSEISFLALLSQKEVERLKLFLEMTREETQSEAFQAEQPIRAEAARVNFNRLLELIQKEQALKDAFGASHPLVDAAKQEIEITKQFMEKNAPVAAVLSVKKLDPSEMLETYTLLLRNDIAELEKRKTILLDDSETEHIAAKEVENDFMRGTALRAKLNRAQARYDQVILRLQELNLSKSYAGFSTDLLTNPEPAKKAAWPKIPILAGLGLFLGFGLGVGMAIVADLLDKTFNSAEDIENATGATIIAHIPRFVIKKSRSKNHPETKMAPTLVSFHTPRSAEAEIYRIARTSLLISNRKGAVRTMMMTSPQPGDGKSTTLSNLAISFARTGKKVLLIDADLRRPMIAKLFGIEGGPGLADILENNKSFCECIQSTEMPNLFVMPHGKSTSEPAELLESLRLSTLLTVAQAEFDLILVDVPPLLAVADPAIIAPIVDAVILTVRVSKNGRRPVEHAIKLLSDIGIQPTAIVVNGIEKSAQKLYGYGTYSRNQYGYIGKYHSTYSAQETEAGITEPDVLIRKSSMR